MVDRPTLTQYYQQLAGSLEPFTAAAADPFAPTPSGGLPAPNVDTSGIGNRAAEAIAVSRGYGANVPYQKETLRPNVYYEPATEELLINGYAVPADHDTAIANSDQMLRAQHGGRRPSAGAVALDDASFANMVNGIRNPSLWKSTKEGWNRGWRQNQELAGYALQFFGNDGENSLGRSMVDSANRALEKTQVYDKSLTDVMNGDGNFSNYIVANLAMQAPNFLMALASSGVGGLAGGAVKGAAGTALRSVGSVGMRMAGNKAASKTVSSLVQTAAKKALENEALTVAEQQALIGTASYLQPQLLKSAAQQAAKTAAAQQVAGGRMAGVGLYNYLTGLGDTYGESVQAGAPDRATAALTSLPYAVAESIPEIWGAASIFKPKAMKAVTAGAANAGKSLAPTVGAKGILSNTLGTTGRIMKGVGTGALGEGVTEAVQEGLVMANNPNLSALDFSNPEVMSRYINNAGAGMVTGGVLGGAVGASRRRAGLRTRLDNNLPTSLLQSQGSNVSDQTINETLQAFPQLNNLPPEQQMQLLMSQGASGPQAAGFTSGNYYNTQTANTNNYYSAANANAQQQNWFGTPSSGMQAQSNALGARAYYGGQGGPSLSSLAQQSGVAQQQAANAAGANNYYGGQGGPSLSSLAQQSNAIRQGQANAAGANAYYGSHQGPSLSSLAQQGQQAQQQAANVAGANNFYGGQGGPQLNQLAQMSATQDYYRNLPQLGSMGNTDALAAQQSRVDFRNLPRGAQGNLFSESDYGKQNPQQLDLFSFEDFINNQTKSAVEPKQEQRSLFNAAQAPVQVQPRFTPLQRGYGQFNINPDFDAYIEARRAEEEPIREEQRVGAARDKRKATALKAAETRKRNAEAKTKAAEELRAKEEARKKARAEAAAKLKAKKRAEAEAKKRAEEEAKKRAEEEARKKAEAEAEAKKKAEEEAKKRDEEEARKKAEAEAKKKAEEEARKKFEAEVKAAEEQEAKRRKQFDSFVQSVANGADVNEKIAGSSLLTAFKSVVEEIPRNATSVIGKTTIFLRDCLTPKGNFSLVLLQKAIKDAKAAAKTEANTEKGSAQAQMFKSFIDAYRATRDATARNDIINAINAFIDLVPEDTGIPMKGKIVLKRALLNGDGKVTAETLKKILKGRQHESTGSSNSQTQDSAGDTNGEGTTEETDSTGTEEGGSIQDESSTGDNSGGTAEVKGEHLRAAEERAADFFQKSGGNEVLAKKAASEAAADVVRALRDRRRMKAETRHILANTIIELFNNIADRQHKEETRRLFRDAVVSSVRRNFKQAVYSSTGLTPLGNVLQKMNLLQTVEEDVKGQAGVEASTDTSVQIIDSEEIKKDIQDALNATREAGETARAWDWIEELTTDLDIKKDATEIRDLINDFVELVQNEGIPESELVEMDKRAEELNNMKERFRALKAKAEATQMTVGERVEYKSLQTEIADLESQVDKDTERKNQADNITPAELEFIEKKLGVKLIKDGKFNEAALDKLFANAQQHERPEGMLKRSDGQSVGNSLGKGQVSTLAKAFVSKLTNAPNVHVFSNLEELKNTNPELYKQAQAARPDGSLDNVQAAGYAFGDTVIIFSDNIFTKEQLQHTLSHEAMGHFGLRSIMNQQELSKLLNDIYNSSEEAKRETDKRMELYGISKEEAIEEYMADKAANLDASLFRRIWAAIKRAFNKIGIRFDDDMALGVITQARKYVREGRVNANIKALGATPLANSGRFMAVTSPASGISNNILQHQPSAPVDYITALQMNQGAPKFGLLTKMKSVFTNANKSKGMLAGIVDRAAKVINEFRSLDSMARECSGIGKILDYFQRREQLTNTIRNTIEEMRETTIDPHTTEMDKHLANKMLNAATLYASANLGTRIAEIPEVVTVDADGNRSLVSEAEQEKLLTIGLVTAEEFSKGLSFTNSLNQPVTIPGIQVTEDSRAYKVYVENHKAMVYMALQKAKAELAMAEGATENYYQAVADIFQDYSSPIDKNVEEAANMMGDVYMKMLESAVKVKDNGIVVDEKAVRKADELMHLFSDAITDASTASDWVNSIMYDPKAPKKGGIPAEFLRRAVPGGDLEFIKVIAAVAPNSSVSEKSMTAWRNAIRTRALNSQQAITAERKLKETIARQYVPLIRRGTKQLRVIAYDENGERVHLSEAYQGVMPRFHGEMADIQDYQKRLEEMLPEGKKFLVEDTTGAEVEVTFTPEVSDVEDTAPLGSTHTDLHTFINMLSTLNVNLDAFEMRKVVRQLANQSDNVMNRLHRASNPGFDPNAIRAVAEFCTRGAREAAAKTYYADAIDLFTDETNWSGSKRRLEGYKTAVINAKTAEEQQAAQREYDAYAYAYMHMAPKSRSNRVVIAGKEKETLGRGNYYKEKAKELMRWSQEASDISHVSGDMFNSELGGKIKSFVVMSQLGGSIATALINSTSILTNSLPYFATYNTKTAFGLGHGFGRSAAALARSLNNLKNFRMADIKFLEDVRDKGTWENYGLTQDELDFLITETKNGGLQAVKYNHLMGDARGKTQNNVVATAVKTWMAPFTYTEQLNRRATALAAYRLERARGTERSKAATIAMKAVDTTQGNYSAFNRPALGRHNIGQYMYMYKHFMVTTLQLLQAMDWKGRTAQLGMLFLLSGAKGMPFADDMLDLIDTLCQALGIKMGSVEAAAANLINDIAPGMAPYVMRGIVDANTGMTVSTRVGMGDILPLTGAFKAGADSWREASDFIGPMVSGLTGSIAMAMSLGRLGLEKTGIKQGHTTFNDILRQSPITAFRMVGDAAAYASDGSVTNMTGAVIKPNVTTMDIANRILGFYPASATLQNDVVRMMKQQDAYIKETKAHFVGAYVRAAINGDEKTMRSIAKDVQDWNTSAKKVAPDMVISDFMKSARKAVKAAQLPTGQRHLKTASRQIRDSEKQLLAIYGYDDDDDF